MSPCLAPSDQEVSSRDRTAADIMTHCKIIIIIIIIIIINITLTQSASVDVQRGGNNDLYPLEAAETSRELP